MSKFKAGDRVLIRAGDSYCSKVCAGSILTIMKVFPDYATFVEHKNVDAGFQFDLNDFNTYGGAWLDELTLVPTKKYNLPDWW